MPAKVNARLLHQPGSSNFTLVCDVRDIKEHEEICWNYGKQYFAVPDRQLPYLLGPDPDDEVVVLPHYSATNAFGEYVVRTPSRFQTPLIGVI